MSNNAAMTPGDEGPDKDPPSLPPGWIAQWDNSQWEIPSEDAPGVPIFSPTSPQPDPLLLATARSPALPASSQNNPYERSLAADTHSGLRSQPYPKSYPQTPNTAMSLSAVGGNTGHVAGVRDYQNDNRDQRREGGAMLGGGDGPTDRSSERGSTGGPINSLLSSGTRGVGNEETHSQDGSENSRYGGGNTMNDLANGARSGGSGFTSPRGGVGNDTENPNQQQIQPHSNTEEPPQRDPGAPFWIPGTPDQPPPGLRVHESYPRPQQQQPHYQQQQQHRQPYYPQGQSYSQPPPGSYQQQGYSQTYNQGYRYDQQGQRYGPPQGNAPAGSPSYSEDYGEYGGQQARQGGYGQGGYSQGGHNQGGYNQGGYNGGYPQGGSRRGGGYGN